MSGSSISGCALRHLAVENVALADVCCLRAERAAREAATRACLDDMFRGTEIEGAVRCCWIIHNYAGDCRDCGLLDVGVS